ncbi:MAG: Cytochrome c-type biogenesis protein DsbD, protein-disulfide reductase [Candidatus Jettenia ecosi]|uniref:Cytochrome c-type biogenesis protein DsbD, protein-disulfide reductase n=1 Tax=Candidatus Jettenia ecosi TaxID=2494326 RepID=A0A533Q9H7_9BACT|nr:MAG: Cytochrome c-type biogenesis protein DsbD, protein-disulfide reductase [Candidatus Jettenia ecosi]
MNTGFPIKRLFALIFISFLYPLVTFGETPPFKLQGDLLKDHVSADSPIPVTITFTIAPNYYTYKDQVKVESGDPSRFTVTSATLPAGKVKYDQFLEKEVEIYEGQVKINTFLQLSKDTLPGPYHIKLKVHYQGCSDKMCFAPKIEELALPVQVESSGLGVPVLSEGKKLAPPVSQPEEEAEPDGFQKTLESRGLFVSLILIFLAGIGLSFTPCVYPMIPITVAIIGGQAAADQASGRRPLKALILSLIYVLGIAVVYASLGVVAASTGALFGTALQSPWVIGFVVVVFVALALSMFGLYTLRVPSFISDRLGTKTGKGFLGVFIMGLISGIVASPCIGPVLASLLVYIASTGNKFLGFWMLFIFAWGLGVPLIVLGTFSGAIKALPKSGEWMVTIERIFGLLLLGVALYYVRFIISENIFIIILGLFLIITGVFSGGFDRLTSESTTFQRARRAFGLIVFIFGAYFLVGHLIIRGFILPPFSASTPAQVETTKEKIDWISDEEKGLQQAKASGKMALIDFWASWCAACIELDKLTYTNPEVIRELKTLVNIKIDSTNTNDPRVKQLWNKYGIVGLPTVVFVNKDGTVLKDKTITGFVNAQEFLQTLKGLE